MTEANLVCPKSVEELSNSIRGAPRPTRIVGGNTRPIGKPIADDILTTSDLTGISLYEPGALTLVAKSGTPVSKIESALRAENQRLAFEPMDHRGLLGTSGTPTIGGVVAANVSGPRRVQVGACRDHLLGVQFVDGRGDIIRNGGRVMKNVTGYDLVKLLAGSFGTLGVLSEVSLKVLPQVETVAVVLINGLSNEEAVRTMSQAMASPYEVSGAAHTPFGVDGHPVTLLRVEGFEGSVSYRAKAVRDMFGGMADVQIETDQKRAEAGWKWVRDVETFHDQTGDVWRISCVPSDASKLAAAAGGNVLLDWAGGLIWALAPSGRDIRADLGVFDGHATRIKAANDPTDSVPTFAPEHPLIAKISADLRSKFDPRGLFNPGLMG